MTIKNPDSVRKEDIQKISKLRRQTFIKNLIWFIISTLILILFIITVVNEMFYNAINILKFIFSLIMIFAWIFININIFKSLIKNRQNNYICKYGYLKNKYYASDRNSNDNSIVTYYLDVIFNDKTRINRIKCSKRIYKKININNEVLVVTFDNETFYAINLELD